MRWTETKTLKGYERPDFMDLQTENGNQSLNQKSKNENGERAMIPEANPATANNKRTSKPILLQ
jgi:hypothetical protein